MENGLDYHAVALEALTRLGGAGDLAAQRELARRYEEGDGLLRCGREARHWRRLAADAGDVGSLRKLYESCTRANLWDEAEALHPRLFEAGEPVGLREHGLALLRVATSQAEREAAQGFIEQAAQAGDGVAAHRLAMEALEPPHPDVERALAWLEPAVQQGEHVAFELKTQLLCSAYHQPHDEQRQREAWLQAAEQGHTPSMVSLALALEPEAPRMARRWLERAIAAGDEYALLVLARQQLELDQPEAARETYRLGPDDADPALAFRIAVACGDRLAYPLAAAEAGELAARLYWADKLGFEGDRVGAAAWLKQAALSGDMQAMARWGQARLEGDGCLASHADAFFWLWRALRLGSGQAALDLPRCFDRIGGDALAADELGELSHALLVLAASRQQPDALYYLAQHRKQHAWHAALALCPPRSYGARALARLLAEEGLPEPTPAQAAAVIAEAVASTLTPEAIDARLAKLEAGAAELELDRLTGAFGPAGMPPDGPHRAIPGTRLLVARPGGFEPSQNGFERPFGNANLQVSTTTERFADLARWELAGDVQRLEGPAGWGDRALLVSNRALDVEQLRLLLDTGEQRLQLAATYHPEAAGTLGVRLLAVLRGVQLSSQLALPPGFTLVEPPGFTSSFTLDAWAWRRYLHPHGEGQAPYGLAVLLERYPSEQQEAPACYTGQDGLPDQVGLRPLPPGPTTTTLLDGREATTRQGLAESGYLRVPVAYFQHCLWLGEQRLTLTAIAPPDAPEQLARLAAIVESLRWTSEQAWP